jgi:hypothetical protein
MTFKELEKTVITFIVMTGLLFVGNKYLNYSAAETAGKAAAAQAALVKQEQSNAALASQTASQQAQYQAMVASLTHQNQVLLATIAANNAALSKQQAIDKTLPLPELANRWKALGNLGDSDIAATTTGITVTDQGARSTVNQLERIPVLQTSVTDLTTVNANKDKQITGLGILLNDKTNLIVGLNKQIVDSNVACKTEIAAVKAADRKAKKRWFGAGFVSGFLVKFLL